MKRRYQSGDRGDRADLLAHRPGRVVAPSGRPPRASGRSGRRNRYRVPAVVMWNERFRKLRNLLIVVFAVELVWLAYNSPLLTVKDVIVEGATVRKPAEVQRIARLIKPGNIFRVPTGTASRLLEKLPEVATARVERRLPRTLAIIIHERVPVATVQTPGGLWVMDGSGQVFRSVKAPLANVPVLIVRPTGTVRIGKALPMPALPAALASLAGIARLPLPRRVRFHVEANGDTWVQHPNGLKIRFGQLDDTPDRIPLTERMLKGPNGRDLISKLLVLDVTSPGNEFTKRRPEYQGFRFAGERVK